MAGDVALPADFLEQLRAAYPKRDGGGDGRKIVTRLVQQAIANGATWDRILLGAQNYATHCARKGKAGTEYCMMLQTFVGRDWHFDDWAAMEMRTPHQIAQEARWGDLERRAVALGFTTVDRARGYDVALRAVEEAERANERKVTQGLRLVVGR
jgi:hypothetical protein